MLRDEAGTLVACRGFGWRDEINAPLWSSASSLFLFPISHLDGYDTLLHLPNGMNGDILLRRHARPWLSPTGVLRDTAITDGNSAHGTKHRVGVTSSAASAFSAGKSDRTTFNRVLPRRIHFRHNGHLTPEFVGWHEAELYNVGESDAPDVRRTSPASPWHPNGQ